MPGFIHYHVEQNATMHLETDEVCHCVYIKGDAESKILFVYKELFNSSSFIVKLSDIFEGSSFEKTYCINVLQGCIVHKTVTLNYPQGVSPEGYNTYDAVFPPVMQYRLS